MKRNYLHAIETKNKPSIKIGNWGFTTIVLLLLVSSMSVYGQKERKFIRQGNKHYEKAVANSDSPHIDSVGFSYTIP